MPPLVMEARDQHEQASLVDPKGRASDGARGDHELLPKERMEPIVSNRGVSLAVVIGCSARERLPFRVISHSSKRRAFGVSLPEEPKDDDFFFASGYMRGVSSRQALYVGIGRTGLHLGPNWFFRRIFFRGMPCVPWSEIRCVRRQTWSWFSSSKFEMPSVSLNFTITGAAGRAVEQRLDSFTDPGARTS